MGRTVLRWDRFDESDASRYEYRRYIKGTASVTEGRFNGAVSRANWVATRTPRDAAGDFEIPGGLRATFAEDGLIRNGKTERLGYRNNSPVLRTDIEDRYVPDQANGAEYRARDTWGLRGTSRPVGLRVLVDIIYKGAVIDRLDGNKVVATRHWGVHIDDIIT